MILIDANLLLYAYDPSSPHHQGARNWLETTFSEPEPVGLAWMTLLAFLRIVQAHALWKIRTPSTKPQPLLRTGSNVRWLPS